MMARCTQARHKKYMYSAIYNAIKLVYTVACKAKNASQVIFRVRTDNMYTVIVALISIL